MNLQRWTDQDALEARNAQLGVKPSVQRNICLLNLFKWNKGAPAVRRGLNDRW